MKTKLLVLAAALVISVGGFAQIYVKPNATGNADGTSWDHATTLENAMILAQTSPDDIWVQAGTYPVHNTLQVPAETRLFGGFDGTETELSARNYATNTTIFEGNNTHTVVRLGDHAVLNGFTVRNGRAGSGNSSGGGVYMGQDAQVENCYIMHNRAVSYGGGIFAEGDGLVYNTVIAHNAAGIDGSAIYGTSLIVQNNTIVGNEIGIDCLPPDAPTADIIPNSACSGTPNGVITITDPVGPEYEYSIDGGTTWQTSPTFTGRTSHSYTVIVRYIHNTSCENSNSFLVGSSSGAPVITGIDVSPNDSICSSASTTIDLTPQFNKTGSYSYLWSPGGATDEVLTLNSGDITETTTYTVTITNTDNNCESYDDITIYVIDPIAIDNIASTQDFICLGGTSPEITVTPSTTTGITYQWQRSETHEGIYADVESATAQTYTVPNTPASDYWYRCIITTTNGICPPVVSDSIRVQVFSHPATPVRSDANGNVACRYAPHTLSVNDVSGATFNWTAPTGWSPSSETGTTFTTTPGELANDEDITVTAIVNGCTSEPLTIAMTLNDVPSTPGTITFDPASACLGSTFTASIDTVPGATSYTWTTPASMTDDGSDSTTLTVTNAGTTTGSLAVTVTANNDCGPSEVRTGNITINAIPAMPVRSDANGNEVCRNSSHTLAVNAVSDVTFNWTAPTGWSPNSGTGTTFTTTPGADAVNGNITVTRTDNNGCTSEPLTIAMTINEPPTIGEVTPSGADRISFVEGGPPFTPLTISPTGTPPINIQWFSHTLASTTEGTDLGDNNGAQTNSFTPPNNNPTPHEVRLYYYAVATNICGNDTSNISGAHFSVLTAQDGGTGCNTNLSAFAFTNNGMPYFKTDRTWTTGTGTNRRTWSDVVLAPHCNKTDFQTSDWRSGDCGMINSSGTRPDTTQTSEFSSYVGDYFSWCMVHRFQDLLCPGGWRVPHMADFETLQISGATNDATGSSWLRSDAWGGVFGGEFSEHGVSHLGFGSYGAYWSTTNLRNMYPSSSEMAWEFSFKADEVWFNGSPTFAGYLLRCVRDEPEIEPTGCNGRLTTTNFTASGNPY
ncbi:MAG: fibrobacter succinogenes major paralogous domain-containing protein, partial [Bacteroidales bacterium]|nr:fibrobacter succinogenes major paralogous domain-containing protein [Bacteroidales bacterium]